MKILVVRLAREYGGAERSFVNHLVGLKKLGHDVIGITNVPQAQRGLRLAGIKYYSSLWFDSRLPIFLRIVLLSIPQLCQWSAILHQEKPDILNLHSQLDQIGLSLLKPFHHRPVVWKNPGDLAYQLTRGGWRRWLIMEAVARADYIYTVSLYDQRRIRRLLPPGYRVKILLIPTGIDLKDYNLHARPTPRPRALVVGYIGRLDPIKGVKFLVDAWPKIKQSSPSAQLWLIGSGRQLAKLREQVRKLKIDKDVKFWGEQVNISSFFMSIDILVLPSVDEAWGLAAIEGRLFGKAIVASKVGGLAEQIRDGQTGLLVPPCSPQAIAGAVNRIAKNSSLRKRLESRARESAIIDSDFSRVLHSKIVPLFERALVEAAR